MIENHENYNCRVTTDDGSEYLIYANWMPNNNLDYWKGWICHAGHTRLAIDKNLKVFSGECKNDYLGTTDSFELLDYTICKQERCGGCTDDLLTAKHSPTLNP